MPGRIYLTFALAAAACALPMGAGAQAAELHVAVAANLATVLPDLTKAFERQTKIHVIPSLGATAQLTQQIENGAPFDVFLSADVDHLDQLIKNGFVLSDTRTIYARGQLVVWASGKNSVHQLSDLANSDIRSIAIAKPELAPYGAAAIETLKSARLWDKVEKKIVYAPSIAIAKQFADTGNAEAAFTAMALTVGQTGNTFPVDEKLHKPIDQALGIVKASKEEKNARAFTAFLASQEALAILKRFGYTRP
jgi:molybdate transport system substrate-binding protein